jgi:5'-nucleotidase
MDNTIANFDKRALQLLQEKHGPRSVFDAQLPSLTKFPLVDNFDVAYKKDVVSLLSQENFFRSFEPIEGAVEALKEMQAHPSVDVFLCTAPIIRSKFCAAEKVEWVREKFGKDGDEWVRRLIITSDKSLVHGDFLIDDAPEAKGKARKPSWDTMTDSLVFKALKCPLKPGTPSITETLGVLGVGSIDGAMDALEFVERVALFDG